MTRPTVVVLGASGMLGTAVTRELSSRPIRLRAVGRRTPTVPHGCVADVEIHRADLTEPGEVARATEGADAVMHLVAHTAGAGQWRSADRDTAAERVTVGLVHDLVDVLAARERTPVVVFAGTTSQVGRTTAAVLDGTEEDHPVTEYDRQKLAAERALETATAEGVLHGITLRLGTLFSQGTDPGVQDRGVVAGMTRRALAGEPLTMWNDGSVRRDLLCVDDAARAFVAALDNTDALAGRHWLVGTGEATSVGELFTAIARAVSAHTGRPPVPVVSVPPPAESIAADVVDFVVDPSAFQRATGWTARIPLADALASLAGGHTRTGRAEYTSDTGGITCGPDMIRSAHSGTAASE